MNDLISREGVIKAIDRFVPADPMKSDYTQGISVGLAIATMCIERFSQENDDSSQGLVKDLISRQAAIRIAEQGQIQGFEWQFKKLCELPSAEPETIRCYQCKYAEIADKEDDQDGYTCQFHRGSIWFSGSYCSWAERKEE